MTHQGAKLLVSFLIFGLVSCAPEVPPGAAKPAEPERPVATSGREYVAVYASGTGNALQPLFDAYEAETGVRVQLVTGEFPALLGKIDNPGSSPHADVFLIRNFSELWTAAEDDVFRPGVSAEIAGRVSAAFRDAESRWFALSTQPRVIVFNSDLVTPTELAAVNSYASLADPVWKEKLCLSSSNVPGNAALIALLLQRHGEREAELLVRGFKSNTTVAEFESDQDLVDAIVDGRCSIGIAALGEIARRRSQRPEIKVDVHAFDDADQSLHDMSGVGISRHAENPDGAAALLAWLSSTSPNALQASLSFEFPVNSDAPLSAALRTFEGVRAGNTTALTLGFLLEDARLLAERARYR